MPDKSNQKDSFTGLGMRNVLFVDDEVSILNAIQQLFSDDAAMRLLVALSGEEALEIVRK